MCTHRCACTHTHSHKVAAGDMQMCMPRQGHTNTGDMCTLRDTVSAGLRFSHSVRRGSYTRDKRLPTGAHGHIAHTHTHTLPNLPSCTCRHKNNEDTPRNTWNTGHRAASAGPPPAPPQPCLRAAATLGPLHTSPQRLSLTSVTSVEAGTPETLTPSANSRAGLGAPA